MKTTCSETEEKWQKRIQFFDVGNNSEMCKIRKTLKLLWDRENKGRRSPGKTLPIYCHQDFASLSYFMRVFGSNIPTHFHWPLLLLSVIFLCTTFGNLSCQLLEFSCILIPKIFRIQKTVKEGQRKNVSWLLVLTQVPSTKNTLCILKEIRQNKQFCCYAVLVFADCKNISFLFHMSRYKIPDNIQCSWYILNYVSFKFLLFL